MDTKSLDKQDKAHLQIYQNLMFAAKIRTLAIIATLPLMAATPFSSRVCPNGNYSGS